ncbi:MAG: hypothetical protein ACXWVP_01930 [Burkholderiales bacterium]
MLDRALWVTWYNLPDEGREEYLAWLHETHLPALPKRPGFLWASHYASLGEGAKVPRRTSGQKFTTTDPKVPKGDRYILLIGAANADVFGNPVPSALHAELPAESRKMVAMRIGQRMNIMVEVARVEGPELPRYSEGMTTAPCIQMGSFQCRPEDEEDALAWYAQWRMPAMAKLAGCVRTRRLASVCGWAKHSILYEFLSLDARNHFIATHEDGDANRAWSDKVVASLTHAPGSANIALRTWPKT